MNYAQIKPYIEKGLINEQRHPEDNDIAILNYAQITQFSQAWDEVTTQCRGLIMNVVTGEIVARPFPKFWNYGEHIAKGWPIPTETPIVTDKLDGSLGILYELNGKPWIATRGSFTSDQAQWATKWWRKNVAHIPDKGVTHLFEIIASWNRIVVKYDNEGLIRIASIDNATGKQITSPFAHPAIIDVWGVPYTDLETLSRMDEPNSEGFVLFYPNANMRMKIKFPEYVRLHKLITGVNEIAIWEHLRDGKTLDDLVEKVPDEYFAWLTGVANRLRTAYHDIESTAQSDFGRLIDGEHLEIVAGRADWRKDFAIKAKQCKYPSLLFAMLDGKDYQPAIWRMLRPRGQSTYAKDIDA